MLDSAGLPYGVVRVPEEIVNDPQLHTNKIIVPIANGGGERKFTVDSPFTIEEQSKVALKVAPGLSEQTDDVLHELRFEAIQINSLAPMASCQQIPGGNHRRMEAKRQTRDESNQDRYCRWGIRRVGGCQGSQEDACWDNPH